MSAEASAGPAPGTAALALDDAYTADDHAFRDDDAYAHGKYALTLRWLGPAAGRSLLEVGCGAGVFTAMAAAAGFRVTACEPDPDAHARALRRAPAGTAVHLAGLDGIAALAEGPADVVVSHDVLEHIAVEGAAVDRYAELVRPGGVLVLSVPSQPWLFGLHDEQLGHHRRYTRRTLRRALEPRFEIVRLRSYGLTFLPLTLWFSKLARRPYPTQAASSGGVVAPAFRAMCQLESRVPAPIGTALVVEARPRP